MEFYEEAGFDREQYDSCLRRLHYDDRDAVMYENMLSFLWQYIIEDSLEDKQGLYEEYTHWNLQFIDKVYYREMQRPYAEIQRAFQSFICLLDDRWQEGLEQLDLIRQSAFCYDGYAPKTIMVSSGKVYQPCSRLFILYNYYKYFIYHEMSEQAEQLKEKYPYAFTAFGDEEHAKHDAFLKEQLEEYRDQIFYPVFHRVYKLPRGPKDFFLYCEEGKSVSL